MQDGDNAFTRDHWSYNKNFAYFEVSFRPAIPNCELKEYGFLWRRKLFNFGIRLFSNLDILSCQMLVPGEELRLSTRLKHYQTLTKKFLKISHFQQMISPFKCVIGSKYFIYPEKIILQMNAKYFIEKSSAAFKLWRYKILPKMLRIIYV